MKRYTLSQARYILSHIYCVLCAPEDGPKGFASVYVPGLAECECCRCGSACGADLRTWIPSVAAASEWLAKENAAIDAFNLAHCRDSATLKP